MRGYFYSPFSIWFFFFLVFAFCFFFFRENGFYQIYVFFKSHFVDLLTTLGGNVTAATMGRHRAHPPAAGALGEGEAGVVRRRRRPARAPAHLHQPRPAGNHSVQLLRAALCKFCWPLYFFYISPFIFSKKIYSQLYGFSLFFYLTLEN